MKHVLQLFSSFAGIAIVSFLLTGIIFQPVNAQSSAEESDYGLKSLRSDVGLHGFTANFHQLSDLTYKGNKTLQTDGSSELEIVYRNVRMMTQRLGVGYQLLTSFAVDGENSSFAVGSWGAGPVFRAYPFRTDQVQPYVQLNSLFGKNLGVSTLANTREAADGFRVRLGIRGGVAVRLNNTIGLFSEVGYDWESSRVFRSDARALQANIGIDFYLFN